MLIMLMSILSKNEQATTRKNKKNAIVYGKVTPRLANDIKKNYNVDVSQKYHVLQDNDLRHIRNSHGEETNEKYPVTKEDLKRIPDIVNNYDDVIMTRKENGKVGIYYVKQHNGVTYYLEQVGDGNLLNNKQMIKVPTGTIPNIKTLKEAINKKWNTDSAPNGENTPRMYVQDAWNDVPTDRIAESEENINGNNRNFERNPVIGKKSEEAGGENAAAVREKGQETAEQSKGVAGQSEQSAEQPQGVVGQSAQRPSEEGKPMSEQVEEILRSEQRQQGETVKEVALPVQEKENNIRESENPLREVENPLQEVEDFVPPVTTRAQALRRRAEQNSQHNISRNRAIQGNFPTANQDMAAAGQNAPVARNGETWYHNTIPNTRDVPGGEIYEGRTEEGTGRHSTVRQATGSGRERRGYQGEYPNNEGPEVSKSRLDGRGNHRVDEGVRAAVSPEEPLNIIERVRKGSKHGAASALKEMRNRADDEAAIEATRARVEQMRAAAEQPQGITQQPRAVTEQPQGGAGQSADGEQQSIVEGQSSQRPSEEGKPMSEQVEEILRSEQRQQGETVKEVALPVQEKENNIRESENPLREVENPLQEVEGFVPPATTRAQALRRGNFQPNMSGNGAIQGNSPTVNQDVVVTRRGTPVAQSRGMGYNDNTTNTRGGVTYEGRTEEGTGRYSTVRQADSGGGQRRGYQIESSGNEESEVSKSRLDGRGNYRVDERVRAAVSPEEPLNIIDRVRKGSKHGAAVDNHDLDFYRDKATSFVSEDGEATISVKKDGDIVAFGKTPNSKIPKVGRKLMYTALENGGTKLDCYGERLAEMYQTEYGFIPVAKVKYNEEYADADMRRYVQEVRGGNPPDIYVMMHNGDDVDIIRQTDENDGYELTDLDSLPVMEYEEALKYRDGLLAEQQGQPAQTTGQSTGGEQQSVVEGQSAEQSQGVTEQPEGATEQPERKQRRLVKRMKKDEELSEQIKNWLDENPDVSNYEVRHNEEVVKEAERRVEEGYSSDRFMNVDSRRADVTDVATGFALLRKYNAEKNWDASYNVVQKLSEMSTNTAQALQIYSIYARQTPDLPRKS